jgi:hypothetical protein
MPRHSTKFRNEWKAEFSFIEAVTGEDTKGRCKWCSSEFSISHGGKSDIKDHVKTLKHQNGKKNVVTHSKIPDLFEKHPSESYNQPKLCELLKNFEYFRKRSEPRVQGADICVSHSEARNLSTNC